MVKPTARYITDSAGNRTEVIVPLRQYESLLDAAEELEAIRAYDRAKAEGGEAIPYEQAIDEIERGEA